MYPNQGGYGQQGQQFPNQYGQQQQGFMSPQPQQGFPQQQQQQFPQQFQPQGMQQGYIQPQPQMMNQGGGMMPQQQMPQQGFNNMQQQQPSYGVMPQQQQQGYPQQQQQAFAYAQPAPPQPAPTTQAVSAVGPGVSSKVSLPFINSAELADSERVFFQSGPTQAGVLTAETARNVLVQSGLPQDILGRIWTLSNVSGGTALTFPEFALAMYLTKLQMSGQQPPFALPDPVKAQVVAANMVLAAPAPVPEVRWAITPQEKQQWDQIFKTWDPQTTGYVSGERARNVFLQSGLSPDLLGHIWTLCDTQNRGKLNADEFAVAMHLVYAKLAGQDLPRVLPPELVPPSTRDLDDMANMMKAQVVNNIQNKQTSAPAAAASGADSSLPAFLRSVPSPQDKQVKDQQSAQRRRDLESELESKRRQVRDAKDAVADTKRDARRMEDEIRDLRRSVESLQLDLDSQSRTRDDLYARGGNGGLDLNAVSQMETEIRGLADECRSLEARLAERKTDALKRGAGGNVNLSSLIPATAPGSDPVANRAAQMLSQRMAALGGAGSDSEIARVEEDRKRREREVQDLLGDARSVVDQLRGLGSGSSNHSWTPSDEDRRKYEDGVGLTSSDAKGIVDRARTTAPSSAPSRTSPALKTQPSAAALPTFLRPGASPTPGASPRPVSPAPPPVPPSLSAASSRAEEMFPSVDSLSARFPSPEDIVSGRRSATPTAPQPAIIPARAPSPLRPPRGVSPAPIPQQRAAPRPAPKEDDELEAQMARLMALDAQANELNAQPISGISSPMSSTPLSTPLMGSQPGNMFSSNPSTLPGSPAIRTAPPNSGGGGFNQGIFNTPEATASLAPAPVVPTRAAGGSVPVRASTQNVIAQAQAAIQAAKDRMAKAKEESKAVAPKTPAPAPIKVESNPFGSNDDPFDSSPNPFSNNVNDAFGGPPSGFGDDPNPFDSISRKPSQPRAPIPVSAPPVSGANKSVQDAIAAARYRMGGADDDDNNDEWDDKPKNTSAPGKMSDKMKSLQSNVAGVYSSGSAATKKPVDDDWEVVSNPAGVLYTIRALYNYDAAKADDLSLMEGDVVGVEREEGEWLFGTKNGSSGWFPKTYVETVPGGSASNGSATGSSGPMAEVLYDYARVNEDELTVIQGEHVGIIDKSDADWWRVENQFKESGLVPATYLSEVASGFERGPGGGKSSVRPGPVRSKTGASVVGKPSSGGGVGGVLNDSMNINSKPGSAATSPSGRSPGLYVTSPPRSAVIAASNPFSPDGDPFASGDDPFLVADNTASSNVASRKTSLSTNGARPSFNSGPTAQYWSNQVDPVLLDSLDPDERKRQEAIYELISTEKSYVRDLQLIIEVFYHPMSGLVTPDKLNGIFSNIEELLFTNTLILSDFESLQEASHYYIQSVGDVFVKHSPSLECYSIYCGNQSLAAKLLQKLRQDDKRLGDFLKSCQKNPKCRALDLTSFLLEPMQRILRYSILLEKVLHYTPKNHPDHQNVILAMNLSEKIAGRVNEAAREKEALAHVIQIAKLVDVGDENIDLSSPTKFMGPRSLVLEGPLAKTKSGRKLHGYLFNDILLLVEPKTKADARGFQYILYRRPMYLTDIVGREVPVMGSGRMDGADDSCFQVVFGEEIITVRAASVAEKRKWLTNIENQCAIIRAMFS
ncbi:hypothetical protein SmJEL517_g03690 [Synchytrium microbalum]|uniref:Actin cytoskeleton-regulatory complex protein PAN1 n=1 Tax=Synchytrium microbalum TaxID=1806994 RepID=A0A507C2Q3_9FUNG|nr:uncharacterized protein SmJEL517_g03690 [Synchytrium microbalum]TPX33329.1 hypothetical protein SmJEL517_g03690 [Synchytrium microbalum]